MTEHEWLVCEDPQRMLRLRRTDCCGCFWIAHEDGSVSVSAGSRPCAQCDNGPVEPRSIFSNRQLRLFAAACYRDVAEAARGIADAMGAAEKAEYWAENGHAAPGVRESSNPTHIHDRAIDHATGAAGWSHYHRGKRTPQELSRTQAALLREIMGNPYRSLSTEPILPVVARMAQLIYDTRDYDALPMLADRLEDSGYPDGDLLRHLRGEEICSQRRGKCRRCGEMFYVTNKYSGCNTPGCEMEDGYDKVTVWIPLRGPHVRGCWALDYVRGVT